MIIRTQKRPMLVISLLTGAIVAKQSNDPRIFVRHMSQGQIDDILDRHTEKKFYARPIDANFKLQMAREVWGMTEVQMRVKEICESVNIDLSVAENIWKAATRELPVLLQPEFIERFERDDRAAMREIIMYAVVGWEGVKDTDTGEIIPFSQAVLTQLCDERSDFWSWCLQYLVQALRQFDQLVVMQRAEDEKNS